MMLKTKKLITQLGVLDNGVSVSSTGIKGGKVKQKIQATPEKVKPPVAPLQGAVNEIKQESQQTPVVEEQVVEEQVVEEPKAPAIDTSAPVIQTSDQTVEYVNNRPKGVTFTQIEKETGAAAAAINNLASEGLI